MEVAIIGGGNFGTAIANIAASNGYTTYLWMRDEHQVAECVTHRENRRYLPGHRLDDRVVPTADLATALERSSVILMTVPSASFRRVSEQLARFTDPDDVIVSATKGIERHAGGAGFLLMSQILEELVPGERIGVLSGPNLAEEIADRQYSGTVVASRDPGVCDAVREVLKSDTFRVYENGDLYGVELAGALKNIYAIVCGLAGGLGVGNNTIAMLVTRSLAEMSRFAVSLGANPFTFLGLAGVGDLLVTCSSPLSRNYQLGFRLAQGQTLEEAQESLGKLAEGVNTLRVIYERARELDVYMPLATGLHRVLFDGESLAVVVHELMTGGQPLDVEFARPEPGSAGSPLR
ncbi:MAG: NAD(P)H-dependent glycerol-3-phosphate dehydrogenase [Pseudomonadota bacterium]